MKRDDCIFCKIAGGEIPSATLFEDERFRVILDVSPASRGHALILTKEHYADIYGLPTALTAEAFLLAQKIAKKLTDVLQCDGFNLVQNNKACAGQTVFHFHIHLIPRYNGDLVGLNWTPGSLTEEDRNAIVGKMNKTNNDRV